MAKEIYIRTEDDPYYDSSIVEFSNEVEELITQLRVLLSSHKGEVLGGYDFGTQLDNLVFNTKRNGESICKDISQLINQYCYISPNLEVTTDMEFGKDNYGRDYGVLNININGEKAAGFLIEKD